MEKDKQFSELNESDLNKELKLYITTLKELENYRLPQRAYHIIRLAIRDLILTPGRTILEREMAETLEMSRTPVREALVRLETEGMVHLIPRRGFIVEPIVKDDLRDIYEIVETMDGLAVEKATEKIAEHELKQLEQFIERQEQTLQEGNLKKWAILDDEFHNLIIKYAKNKRLNSVIDIHSDQLYRARLFTINHRPTPHKSIIEHKAIVACIKAGDGLAARMVMQSHRKRARQEILEALDRIDDLEKVEES
ncbi:GntR family transcriptional regulator [Alkalihalobacillus sp. MEB130]|uniref:GntR family transcriptional regulator n=1 Tax=Alkalihalobacillus sp. MEB130 TaxID=2976704 RepID=UPI0028DDF660|nr:GntR family transcriptional regulator [Alkalihalobacillus sp. MEB130]MDT8861834.1 GntR family transcriptional regulator [Alkalihalobacillus sp. MEB130]